MRRLLVTTLAAVVIGAVAGTAAAQQASQEELKKRLDAKLAEAWVKDGGWITDYDRAREEAKKGGKPIFTYFTRSYAG